MLIARVAAEEIKVKIGIKSYVIDLVLNKT
jgi:hypothetical protein